MDFHVSKIAEISGCFLLQTPPNLDDRGWFRDIVRTPVLPAEVSKEFTMEQVSVSCSAPGVVRGLHFSVVACDASFYQLVSCVGGHVLDGLVDVRVGSPTFGAAFQMELTPDSGAALLMPPGVAHGYRSLQHGSTLVYAMSRSFPQAKTQGIRADFPGLGLWRQDERANTISSRDRELPTFEAALDSGILPEMPEASRAG